MITDFIITVLILGLHDKILDVPNIYDSWSLALTT